MYTTEEKIDIHTQPTRDTYEALQHAYDHFNWTLFESELPNCLITLQRKGRTYGYFSSKRFIREDGKACDEIALNPIHFKIRTIEESLSTLVHEMVHLWQYHFGKPGRGRYHNRQWADKMKSLGLHPSHTGEPGGNELGDQMTHYILDGDTFARSVSDLLKCGFELQWREEIAPQLQLLPAPLSIPGGIDPVSRHPLATSPTQQPSKSGQRAKYTCPECGLNAWARHGAFLICGEDQAPIGAEENGDPERVAA